MSNQKKWNFSDAGHGPYPGFNNSGIDMFRNKNSLYREVLQNAGDNPTSENKPVTVIFKKISMKASNFGINKEFIKILNNCKTWTENQDKDDVQDFYKNALKLAKQDKVDVLFVSDYNTKGLYKNPTNHQSNYFRLIISPGSSKKSGDGGGSHGHGQHAAYAKSGLRTVFFQSYIENKIIGTEHKKLFVGKTILNSWEDSVENITYVPTGFYGKIENKYLIPFFDNEIPKSISDLRNKTGTDIMILAPKDFGDMWTYSAQSEVVSHFFAAINDDKIIIELNRKNSVNRIDKETLDDCVRSSNNLRVANYLKALRQNDPELIFTKEIEDLGKVEIRIDHHEKGNQSIVLLRRPRMKILEYNKPILSNYSGVIIIDDIKGNDVIRNLEDGEHKKLEKDRLPPGKNYIEDLEEFIDETLLELCKTQVDEKIYIQGLGSLLPSDEDMQRDGENNSDSEEEDTISQPEKIEIQFNGKIQQFKPTLSNLILTTGTGTNGGGGGSSKKRTKRKGGKGTGGNLGGNDDGKGVSIINSITLRSFIQNIVGDHSTYKCVIRAKEDCEGVLGLKAIGLDSVSEDINIDRAVEIENKKETNLTITNGGKIKIDKIKKNQKKEIIIYTNLSIPVAIVGSN